MKNWNEKRGELLTSWRSQSYVYCDLQKEEVFTLFFNQLAARGFHSFSKSGPSCEKLAHPWVRHSLSFHGSHFTLWLFHSCEDISAIPPELRISKDASNIATMVCSAAYNIVIVTAACSISCISHTMSEDFVLFGT